MKIKITSVLFLKTIKKKKKKDKEGKKEKGK